MRDEKEEIDDNIKNTSNQIERLKEEINSRYGKTDKTINDLIKENNELKKKLQRAKAK